MKLLLSDIYQLENAPLPYGREGVYWIDGEVRVLVGVPENLNDILDLIEEEEIDLTFISHAHDIGPVQELQERSGCDVVIHEADGESIKNLQNICLAKDGDIIAPGCTILHCPGHTAGSAFLKYEYASGKFCLFTGDTLAGEDGDISFAPDVYSQNVEQMKQSVLRIAQDHDFDAIFPSWGEPILTDVRQLVMEACQSEK